MSDPVTLAVAAAIAGKVSESLTDAARSALKRLRRAVRERFFDTPEARRALEAAQEDPDDEPALARLSAYVSEAEERDPAIRRLTDELRSHLSATHGGVINHISGDVRGNVVQARDITGGVHL